MDTTGTWIVGAIVAAEAAFWVVLMLGLSARYVLRLRRTSSALLVAVPLIDVILLALVAVDLSRGAEPSGVHGLAAVYLGFSVGFGHRVITLVDAWFAHRFAAAPRPERPPRSGPGRVRHEWEEWLRAVRAWAVAVAALLLMKVVAGWSVPSTAEQLWSDEIWAWVARLTLIVAGWFVAGPLWVRMFPPAASESPSAHSPSPGSSWSDPPAASESAPPGAPPGSPPPRASVPRGDATGLTPPDPA